MKGRVEVRQVGPSSRRPGAGPTVGTTFVVDAGDPVFRSEFERRWAEQGPLCAAHGQKQPPCSACGAPMHVCPGVLPHSCFDEPDPPR